MKVFALYLFIALVAISVQASLLFKITRPDFVLILVCFYSLKHGQIRGMAYGALTGLLIDSASGFILGPNILSKTIIGFLMGAVKQKVFQWNIFIHTVLIVVFSFIDIFLVYICLETFAGISFVNRSLGTYVMQAVYTAGAGLILYPFLNPDKDSRIFLQARNRF